MNNDFDDTDWFSYDINLKNKESRNRKQDRL